MPHKNSASASEARPLRWTPSKVYIFLYNIFMFAGFFVILIKSLASIRSLRKGHCYELYQDCRTILQVFQTASCLEVLHAMLGIVKANPWITFVQMLSRNFIVWAAVSRIDSTHYCIGTCIILFTWSMADCTRYAFFALSTTNSCPYAVKWLRYSLFTVLYPIGVQGELNIVWHASQMLRFAGNRNDLSLRLPNKLNFGFDYLYLLRFGLVAYLYFPFMYAHMLTRRRRVLGLENGSAPADKKVLKPSDSVILFQSKASGPVSLKQNGVAYDRKETKAPYIPPRPRKGTTNKKSE